MSEAVEDYSRETEMMKMVKEEGYQEGWNFNPCISPYEDVDESLSEAWKAAWQEGYEEHIAIYP